ncbi:hypothetical protein OG413_36095 [Streptomyces sp. NBC_01433]|uniref:hypothetical protein n=1 Tax=Streptomyces sp. NBC_01433 TaxID=2903864 RepID=UPI0022514AE4|nr:hypothetical protein [Streptomyces sp. NBC_01433]MCX4680637.1 hypothetical protein [Streptomyces sp. NBC_01433]
MTTHTESPAVFTSCATLEECSEATARFLADRGGRVPVPVWTGPRADLVDGMALAEEVYDGRRTPLVCTTGVFVGVLPPAVMDLARPLATAWVSTPDELPADGAVLIVGTYQDLDGDSLHKLIERAHRERRGLHVLTGRDVHSVSWMIAKQYGRPVPHGRVGVFSELDTLPPVGDAAWHGAEEVAHQDVQALALKQVWRRVLFHGHGKDDQLNLGQYTLCGLSPVRATAPGAQGPRCAYGLGCPKPEDKLIPANAIRTAEIVMSGCYSGPLAGHSVYDPKYVLLLNAIDGPPQTVLAALSACDAGRPETAAWLTTEPGRDGGTALALNRRLADINPYPAFLQVGLEPSAAWDTTARPAAVGGQPAGPQGSAADDDTALPLRLLGTRLSGYLGSGLLGGDHPLQRRLQQFSDRLLIYTARTNSPPAGGETPTGRELAAELASLDLALAQRLARDSSDPLLDFPTYFGVRSTAREPAESAQVCACGRPLLVHLRRGTLPVITDTVQAVCPRCGDVLNSYAEAPELRVEAAGDAVVGTRLPVTVEVIAHRAGTVNVGVTLPSYLDARVQPLMRRVVVRPGQATRTELALDLAPEAAPQAYYFTVFAVHDLGLAAARVQFGLHGADPAG